MPPRDKNEPAAITEHPLVSRLSAAGGSGTPEPTTVLQGFLGRGPAAGRWRLYLSAALDDYVEIPEDAILATETLPDNQGNQVWVRAGTSLVRHTTTTRSVQAEFLSGGISARAAAAAQRDQAGLGRAGFQFGVTHAPWCEPTYVQTHCPSCWCETAGRGC